MAQHDMMKTNSENQNEADRVYGNGVIFCRDIDENIKRAEVDKKDIAKKQLDLHRKTFFEFVKERQKAASTA